MDPWSLNQYLHSEFLWQTQDIHVAAAGCVLSLETGVANSQLRKLVSSTKLDLPSYFLSFLGSTGVPSHGGFARQCQISFWFFSLSLFHPLLSVWVLDPHFLWNPLHLGAIIFRHYKSIPHCIKCSNQVLLDKFQSNILSFPFCSMHRCHVNPDGKAQLKIPLP